MWLGRQTSHATLPSTSHPHDRLCPLDIVLFRRWLSCAPHWHNVSTLDVVCFGMHIWHLNKRVICEFSLIHHSHVDHIIVAWYRCLLHWWQQPLGLHLWWCSLSTICQTLGWKPLSLSFVSAISQWRCLSIVPLLKTLLWDCLGLLIMVKTRDMGLQWLHPATVYHYLSDAFEEHFS